MQIRLRQHGLKMAHLNILFQRELKNWKVHCYKLSQQGSDKSLTFKFSKIKEEVKQSLLKQYFDMCKMAYRINSIVAFNWAQGVDSFDLIFRLYN